MKISTYVIDYQTGSKETVHGCTLSEVKKRAVEGMKYTKKDVLITDLKGNIVAFSKWCPVPTLTNSEKKELEFVGGYYSEWSDK